jgi:hypothetical protein
LQSRQAADVTRRVMAWAVQHEEPLDMADSQPLIHQ